MPDIRCPKCKLPVTEGEARLGSCPWCQAPIAPEMPAPSKTESATPPRSGRPLLWIAGSAVVILLVIAGIWFTLSGPEKPASGGNANPANKAASPADKVALAKKPPAENNKQPLKETKRADKEPESKKPPQADPPKLDDKEIKKEPPTLPEPKKIEPKKTEDTKAPSKKAEEPKVADAKPPEPKPAPPAKLHRFMELPFLATGSIKIDGDLADWKGMTPVLLKPVERGRSPKKPAVVPKSQKAFLAYCPQGILVALDVVDASGTLENQGKPAKGMWPFWDNDAVEIYIDTLNTRAHGRGESNAHQFFAFPFGVPGDAGVGGYESKIIRDEAGKTVWTIVPQPSTGEQAMLRAGRKTATGWTMEILIPTQALRHAEIRPGNFIAFELQIDTGTNVYYHWACDDPHVQVSTRPNLWGELMFAAPARAAPARAGDAIEPGKLELYPTLAAVGIELPYAGDDNHNAAAQFVWRRAGDKTWHNGVDMTLDRKRRLIWASIWPLEQGENIEVKITLTDPDAGKDREIVQTVSVRRLTLEPQGGRTFHVSSEKGDDANPGTEARPFKTLAHAARQVKPGDMVLAVSGIYAEGDLLQGLKGTEDKPIVFAAAPKQEPILDSSLVLEKGKGRWKEIGGGVFVTSADFHTQAGGYVAQDGLRMFFYPSLDDLKSDKLKVQRAWFYDAKAKLLYVRTGTSKPANEHAYNLSRHAYAFHLSKSQHVVIRGFTIRNYGGALVRLSEGASGCVLIDNHLHNAPGAVFLKGETTRDNAVWRNHIHEPGMVDFSWVANYGVGYANQAVYCSKAGRGNSFCHNRIHDYFDLIAVESWKNPEVLAYNRDCDILFNELYNAGDDAIEADGGGVNMRIHGNAIRNCHTALSLAPIERGPVYITRNHATFKALFIKFNVGGCTSLGGTYLYHNSGYCLLTGGEGGTGVSFPVNIPCANKVLKNNVIVTNEWSLRGGKEGYVLDGNCYFHVPGRPPRRFQWEKKTLGTIAAFAKASGQEKQGQYADPLFADPAGIGKIDATTDLSALPPSRFPLAPNATTGDLRVRPGSPCIDRGLVIRGINDDFQGKGPDVGAFEMR